MTQNAMVVAEISVRRNRGAGFSWSVMSDMPANVNERIGNAASATEAVWLAVDSIRCVDDPPSGLVAIYSVDGDHVAHPPLWAVPQYELLEWSSVADQLEIAGPGVL